MRIKKLVLLLIVLSVLMSGCLNSGEDQEQEEEDSGDSGGSGGSSERTQRYEELQTPEETITAEETVTSDETETPVETETFDEIGTPEETETAEEMLTPAGTGGIEEEQTENATDEGEEAGTGQSSESEPGTYLVRLKDYLFIPSELEINTGDLVVWRNYEYVLFTLTSEEGLFEDQRLGYGNTFNYTFDETGSYNFSVSGYPNMQMTITVK
ncbi:MAG: hypothetical protein QG610_237 [Euryarchaeota archaeon]|nr:hypothetical protein [Euryarchaeota archaeon]